MTMKLDKLHIRRAAERDAPVLYDMICGLENTVIDRIAFQSVFDRNIFAENIAYFIAELDGKPVGMVSCHIQALLHHSALVSEIQEMYVDPSYRSYGVGHLLMNFVKDYARNHGAIQMEVTSRNYREDAHRFYQKEGFEKSHVKLVTYFDKG